VILKRGDLVLAASSGDHGEPRPHLVIQSNAFSNMPSVTVCPLASDLQTIAPLFRIALLCGGDKSTQNKDIKAAKQLARELEW
jgi:mRNA-degrading endonuclease toxin of MazEF toxin-antitoxin module